MIIGIRAKYFLTFMFMALVVVSTAGIYLEYALGAWLESQLASELKIHALIGRSLIEEREKEITMNNLDPLADLLGRDPALRVTIIDEEGKVLGDSQVHGEALMHMENHNHRPEVQDSIKTGFGQSKRYSTTISQPMLYVATSYHHPNHSKGVIRVSMSLQEVEAIKSRLRMALFVAALLAAISAISISGFSAHLTTRTLRHVVLRAQSMVRTVAAPRIEVSPKHEMAGLAGSLNLLAEEKDSSLEQLSEEKSKMEAVLQSMDEGVIAVDGMQKMTLMNRSVLDLLRLSSVIHGQSIQEIFPGKIYDSLGFDPKRLSPLTTEFDLDGPKSTTRRVLAVITPLRARKGHVLVLRDVTEIRRLEQVRRDFVANVSHELRTPVSIVQANAQTLLEGAWQDEKYRQILMVAIERNAQRLSRIISDLLDLSRLEANRFSLNLEVVTLLPTLLEVVDLFRVRIEEKQIQIHIKVEPHVHILADIEALRKIVSNLLDNAIKYTSDGSSISVSIKNLGSRLRLQVADNGPGIEPQHRDRLFERFYRVDSGRTRKMGGTGLGLSIVKHLAENMKGSAGMEPVKPNGSLFWVSFSSTWPSSTV